MKQIAEHGPCCTCEKCNGGKCAETNAIVTPTGGIKCPWYK